MQTIYLDISNKGVIPCVLAKQSEVGRKFLVVITDNGVPYNIPENSLLSVWYEGDTDAGNYSSIEEKSAFSIDGNKVTVELVAQMLFNPGNGELCLSITHGDGGETNTWNIPYCVEYKPGAGSSVATEYYSALTEAGTVATYYANQAQESAQVATYYANQAQESEQLVSSLFIESDQHNGCYYRVIGNETEWVNPPMALGEEYRTTDRFNGKPVYTKLIATGNLRIPLNSDSPVGTPVVVSDESVDIIETKAKLVRDGNDSGYFPLPYIHNGKICAYIYAGFVAETGGTAVNIVTMYDIKAILDDGEDHTYSAYITVKYTKNEDA